jgi:ATP-dependent Clp protease ATP-binding subunit ClpC
VAVFERFTERARQVVVLAQDEARTLGHDYIGAEHLLLGLLREEEGIAARALRFLDVSIEGVRERVVETVGLGERAATGQIPFTPAAKSALELALREALDLGHTYIGTEHVLLGLARAAEERLAELGVDAEAVRGAVLELFSETGTPGEPARPPAPMPRPPRPRSRPPVVEVRLRGPLYAAIGCAAAAFPLGLLVGWVVWG